MPRLKDRLASLEASAMGRAKPVWRFLHPMPDNPPDLTDEGRPIVYVTWQKDERAAA